MVRRVSQPTKWEPLPLLRHGVVALTSDGQVIFFVLWRASQKGDGRTRKRSNSDQLIRQLGVNLWLYLKGTVTVNKAGQLYLWSRRKKISTTRRGFVGTKTREVEPTMARMIVSATCPFALTRT